LQINSEYHHEVLNRAKKCFGVKSDAALSRIIGLRTRSTITKSRKNKTIPYANIVKTVAEHQYDIDLNYVFMTSKNSNGAA
jgi:hypothetical protein